MVEEASRQLAELSLSNTEPDEVSLLRLQVKDLKTRVHRLASARASEDAVFQQSHRFASAKSVENAVLHALFDQASSAKYNILSTWLRTGVIPTRDGLKHWQVDPTVIRNEQGQSLLHVAVEVSMAREPPKVKVSEFLIDKAGFDPNITDAFGNTPLHVAAMAGFSKVVQSLLDRGADPNCKSRAGVTPLSLVRTLSRPPERVLEILAQVESTSAAMEESIQVQKERAIGVTVFLRQLLPYVSREHLECYTNQVNDMVNSLLQSTTADVDLDTILQEKFPLLFSQQSTEPSLYQVFSTAKLQASSSAKTAVYAEAYAADVHLYQNSYNKQDLHRMNYQSFLTKLVQFVQAQVTAITSPLATSEQKQVYFAQKPQELDLIAKKREKSMDEGGRQSWLYAVVFRPATTVLPGSFSIAKEGTSMHASTDVSVFLASNQQLIIDGVNYWAVGYDKQSQRVQLDRPFEGSDASDVKVYANAVDTTAFPPYITTKRIWERKPGNKFEDQNSSEQELFQDYQFMDPESDLEVALKLGPMLSMKEAKEIARVWKERAYELFQKRECASEAPVCAYYCTQRSGHHLCVESLKVVGRNLAKQKLGRPSFLKELKPRAQLQKLQSQFKGSLPWPGSPASIVLSTKMEVGDGKTRSETKDPDLEEE